MEIRSPQTEQEWKDYYALRYEVLRKPWNQVLGSERDNLEEISQHFAAFNEGKLWGVGRLDRVDEGTFQIRFMATHKDVRGMGVGRLLMVKMEQEAWDLGASKIVLHAREIALPFYEKLGYELIKPSHLLFGEIQHHFMQKKKG